MAGVGIGDHFGLIPSTFTAAQLCGCANWVKWLSDPEKGAVPKRDVNYELLSNYKPAQAKFVKGKGTPLIGFWNETVANTKADYVLLSQYKIPENRQPEYTLQGAQSSLVQEPDPT